MLVTRAPLPTASPPEATVSGDVRSLRLAGSDESTELRVMIATFAPGGRNLWHTHAFDQALWITEGEGVMATEAEEQIVRAGDFVLVPAGERHWHGATRSQAMSHLAFGIPGASDFDGLAYQATE